MLSVAVLIHTIEEDSALVVLAVGLGKLCAQGCYVHWTGVMYTGPVLCAQTEVDKASVGLHKAYVELHEAYVGLHKAYVEPHKAYVEPHEAYVGLHKAYVEAQQRYIRPM